MVLGFIGGEQARQWSGVAADSRRQAVLANLAQIVDDDALQPRDYIEKDWSREERTRGCPVASTPPGVLLDFGPAIRTPVGPVHWAGTETATYWNGYVEGAIRSGERAADGVLAQL